MIRILVSVALVVAAASQSQGISQAAWLRGCWETRTPRAVIEEQWSVPRARTMIMMGRTTRGDSVTETEHVILRENAGRLDYNANPSGQSPTTFSSIMVSDTMLLFENPTHDFPQRVGYARRGADSLLAWIEGSMQGRNRRIDFRYARVSCGG